MNGQDEEQRVELIEGTVEDKETERTPTGRELAPVTPVGMIAGANQGTALALATAARVEAEGKMLLARQYPRDLARVEKSLLTDCARLGFANAARYSRPVGMKKNDKTGKWEDAFARGFSIRFAEAAAQKMGNLDVRSLVVFEDDEKSIIRCIATDLETNLTYSRDTEIPKTVERRKLKDGQKALGARQNAKGDNVYIVLASPQEHEVARAAEVSKKTRDLILRMLPADIKEACETQCLAALEVFFSKSRAGAIDGIKKGFAALSITEAQIAAYLGHPLDAMTSEEYQELTAVGAGIKEGLATWAQIMADKRDDTPAPEGSTNISLVDELKMKAAEKLAKKDEKKSEGTGEEKKPETPPQTATAQTEGVKAPTTPPSIPPPQNGRKGKHLHSVDSTDLKDIPPEPGSNG